MDAAFAFQRPHTATATAATAATTAGAATGGAGADDEDDEEVSAFDLEQRLATAFSAHGHSFDPTASRWAELGALDFKYLCISYIPVYEVAVKVDDDDCDDDDTHTHSRSNSSSTKGKSKKS